MAKQKKGHLTELVCGSHGIQEPYKTALLESFRRQPDIKPRNAWEIFQQMHPPPSSEDDNVSMYPMEKKVKAKISSLKSSYKKTGQLP